MENKAKNYEEAAAECAVALTDEDKKNLQLHIDYSYHHFGYGMYLRNHYMYLLDDESLEIWGEIYSDGLGESIFYLMLPIVFPEFKGYENDIRRLTDTPFNDLNACYYLKFGKNFIADITPEKFFLVPDRKEIDDDDFDDWWESYLSENNKYAVEIAERIWEYDMFKQTASALGYSQSEIEETHQFCKKILNERCFFVPLEILFAKNANPDTIKAIMKNSKLIEWLFSEHSSEIKQLPSYIFDNKDVVKIMVSNKGSLLELSQKYSGDYDVVLTAVKDTPYAMDYADKSLWGNRIIAEEAAKHSESCLVFSIEAFKQFNDDDEIVKLALQANGANICYASERIRANYDMAVFALQHQREIYPNSAFESLSPQLRCRKDLAMIELQAPVPSLDGFSDELLDDDDVAQQLIDNEKITWLFYKMSDRIKRKYLDRLPENVQSNIREQLQ
ncbi:MAG: DUF4116 domain-containing protein [Clostridia bacterium]|nr:DUF4116 domain-containing protein [Clostridia bacterium]